MLPSTEWHLLVLSVSSNNASFYINGAFRVSRTLASNTLTDGGGVLSVGGLPSSSYFTGALQDVRIYQSTLNQM